MVDDIPVFLVALATNQTDQRAVDNQVLMAGLVNPGNRVLLEAHKKSAFLLIRQRPPKGFDNFLVKDKPSLGF